MLRPLLFSLLAANLLFFAWSQWISPVDAGSISTPAGSAAADVLPGSLVAAATSEPAPAPQGCVSLGPFSDATAAERAANLLAAAGKPSTSRIVETRVPDAYWVFVGGLRDAAAQRRTLNAITASGIDDAYSMPNDTDFRVSVGIFSDRERAEQRARRVRALALTPQIEDRFRPESAHWLDLRGVSAAALQAPALLELGIADPALGTVDCP